MYRNTFDAMAFELTLISTKPLSASRWEEVCTTLIKSYTTMAAAKDGVLIGHIKGLAILMDAPDIFIKLSAIHPDIPIQVDRSTCKGKSFTLSLVINALHAGLDQPTADLILSKALGKICGLYELTKQIHVHIHEHEHHHHHEHDHS
ncbi:MAG: hypothetical protein RR310_05155 [Eubacterium sp.]